MTLEGDSAPEFTLPNTGGGTTLLETLESRPTVVLVNRGSWCSFCAEQLATVDRVAEDIRFDDGLIVFPVVTDGLPALVGMRDRFDLSFQLLADPEGEVAGAYSGTEETGHGTTGIAAAYVVDEDGTVRSEQVADHPADRTYGNWVRYFVRNDYEDSSPERSGPRVTHRGSAAPRTRRTPRRRVRASRPTSSTARPGRRPGRPRCVPAVRRR